MSARHISSSSSGSSSSRRSDLVLPPRCNPRVYVNHQKKLEKEEQRKQKEWIQEQKKKERDEKKRATQRENIARKTERKVIERQIRQNDFLLFLEKEEKKEEKSFPSVGSN